MAIKEQLLSLTATERAVVKADAVVAAVAPLAKAKAYAFTDGELSLTVTAPKVIPGGVEVTVSATRDGKALKLSNPFRFLNPPVCVRDEKGEAVEDVAGAFRAMVADAVRSVS